MLPAEIFGKRILISPLNWGMGHVARCIPLIALLKQNKNEVIVAADDEQLRILKQYFPDIKFVMHRGYPFYFGAKGNFAWYLLRRIYFLWRHLKSERKIVEDLVAQHEIDVVISDHRYGFVSKLKHSIFLTHQVQLPVRWYEFPVQVLHTRLMRQFNEVWIPDFSDNQLAGKLSRSNKLIESSYIGPLSRFSMYRHTPQKITNEVVVVSGPTLYAQRFFNEQLNMRNEDAVFIIPSALVVPEHLNHSFRVVRANDWLKIDAILQTATKVYARSGYSTLMDIYYLKCQFELTPTTGQREQEYLVSLWNKNSDGLSRSFDLHEV